MRSDTTMKSGFTLIELLVVISIIAVLAAMLLPAIKAVQRSARSTRCLGNLKQLYLAFQNYAQDNEDYTPPAKDGWHPFWSDRIAPYVGDGSESGNSTILSVWRCPENRRQVRNMGDGTGDTEASYGANGYWGPFWGADAFPNATHDDGRYLGWPQSRIRHREELSAVLEVNYFRLDGWNIETAAGDFMEVGGAAGIRYRHGGRSNALFTDGHVEPRDLILSQQGATAATRRFYYALEP